jgi:hypothetical protein
MRASRMFLALGMFVALAGAVEAQGQLPQARQGFWIGLGLGYGSLGCDGCDDRLGGVSGGLALGGTLNERLLLGAATTGWSRTEEGTTLSAGTLTALARFYPWVARGFFGQLGLGLGSVSAEIPALGNANSTGAGAVLGLGYDVRVAPNFSITPFWNGVGITADEVGWNFGQIGVGVTLH